MEFTLLFYRGLMDTEPLQTNEQLSSVEKEYINLRVCSQDGNEVYFKIRKNTDMKKLMTAYCERVGVTQDSTRFLYNGDRITPLQNAIALEMEDNDVIDAVLAQVGGHPIQ